MCLFSAGRLWNLAGGRFALGGSCQWDQSFDKLHAPWWHLSWKDLRLRMLRPSAGAEPVPLWGRLSSGSVFPSCTEEGDLGRLADASLRLCLLPSASSSRPPAFIIPAFSLVLGASWVHWDTASSRQGVRLGLMHATGSSLGPVNSDSLYQCRFCRVIPKRSRVGQAHQLYLI